MNRWVNECYKLDIDEIEKKVEVFESRGFEFLCDVYSLKSDRVKTPSGRILKKSDIARNLRKLRFSDSLQIESLDALEFFHLMEYY